MFSLQKNLQKKLVQKFFIVLHKMFMRFLMLQMFIVKPQLKSVGRTGLPKKVIRQIE